MLLVFAGHFCIWLYCVLEHVFLSCSVQSAFGLCREAQIEQSEYLPAFFSVYIVDSYCIEIIYFYVALACSNCFKSGLGCSSGCVEWKPPAASFNQHRCCCLWFLPQQSTSIFPAVRSSPFVVLPLCPVKRYKKGQNVTFYFVIIFISKHPRLCLGSQQWCRALSSHPQNSIPQSQPNTARPFLKERFIIYRFKRKEYAFVHYEIHFNN